MNTKSNERFDVYQAITDQIITAIEAGTGPVEMPWHRSGAGITRPMNVDSGKAYRGINTVALWAAAINGGYGNGLWGTYRQWQERGAQVRKGEKSSLIVFYKEFEVEDEAAEDGKGRRFMAKASRVFNVAQVDGYTAPEIDQSGDPIDPIETAERFIRGTGAIIREGGDEICLFSSDYPHVEGGRNPMKRFGDALDGVSEAAQRRFYSENFIDMMGAGLPEDLRHPQRRAT